MSDGLIDSIRSAIPIGGSAGSGTFTTYECEECGDRFESAKDPDRAQCMDCLSREVRQVD